MDNEKLKQFLIPIGLIVATVIAAIYLSMQIVQNIKNYSSTKNELTTTTANLQQAQTQLENAKKQAEENKKREASLETSQKPFYKPVMNGIDSEAAIAGEFAEILELIRANRIKVRSIKYDYDPMDDNFVKGAKSKYNVARLNMEMVANYMDYDNFLKELYKHEHFLDIQSVEIVPYRKNKKILLINFKLKLYAKK